VNHALRLVHANAVYMPESSWPPVVRRARTLVAAAKTIPETYAALTYVVQQLQLRGDQHAVFAPPVSSNAPPLPTPVQSARVSLVDARVGTVMIPTVLVAPNSAAARSFVSNALTHMTRLSSRHTVCAWIVDLRGNQGGDMYPMLLALGPILGSGRLIGFQTKDRQRRYVSYRAGAISGGGASFEAPTRVADFLPKPAVAVLTDFTTRSSRGSHRHRLSRTRQFP
jgi:carboxyl-terminal processing protease